jgi:hypothetical protein
VLSTQVSVTAGQPITITVGAKGVARSRGPAAAIVNLTRCSVDLITVSKK